VRRSIGTGNNLMHLANPRVLSANAGNAKHLEAIDPETGERHYTNYSPYFSLHYYPQRHPERLLCKVWEDVYVFTGYDLLPEYEKLRTNAPDTIEKSVGPHTPGQPYILKIEYQIRL